jgi:very-short-patch-repair endonuclease
MVYLGRSVEKAMHVGAKAELFRLAQKMRKNPTPAEKVLWKQLRPLRFEGFSFRRQHPIDFYIADFYCHRLKLIIEVDGEIHSDKQSREYDDARSGELKRFGITVIRFTNAQVINHNDVVLSDIMKLITKLSSPSPLGEGDRRG